MFSLMEKCGTIQTPPTSLNSRDTAQKSQGTHLTSLIGIKSQFVTSDSEEPQEELTPHTSTQQFIDKLKWFQHSFNSVNVRDELVELRKRMLPYCVWTQQCLFSGSSQVVITQHSPAHPDLSLSIRRRVWETPPPLLHRPCCEGRWQLSGFLGICDIVSLVDACVPPAAQLMAPVDPVCCQSAPGSTGTRSCVPPVAFCCLGSSARVGATVVAF